MAISTINQSGLNAPLTLTSPVLTTPNLGTPSAINLSNATALPSAALPTGCVLQVIFGSTTTLVTNSTTTPVDTTLSATITPKFATSKIAIFVSQNGYEKSAGNNTNGTNFYLLRNATTLTQFTAYLGYTGALTTLISSASVNYLDSPATTSAITYKTQFANSIASAVIRAQSNSDLSTIMLMEIAG